MASALSGPISSKPPFANYDLVVYFGGGIFFLQFAWRYFLGPLGFENPDLPELGGQKWLTESVYLVIFLISTYVVGHVLAYQSSVFIEGMFRKTVGNFSEIIEVTTCSIRERANRVQAKIQDNFSQNFCICGERFGIESIFVLLFHLPMMPWYAIVYIFGLFDFLDTRVPDRMLTSVWSKLSDKFEVENPKEVSSSKRQWFRWIEYYVAHHIPIPLSSMYNYLVISGLMRTLSYVFILAIWAEIFYYSASFFGFEQLIKYSIGNTYGFPVYTAILYIAAVSCLTSYAKFFRRYVEEAIIAFALYEPDCPA